MRSFLNLQIPLPLLLVAGTLNLVGAPDRDSFAREKREIQGVPVDAFELSNENLKVELWARSPLVYSPVAMDFDAKGRLWLTEGIDYNQRPRVDTGRSVMVLEDKDGDGKADTSKVFVTEKEIRHAPLGIAVFDNRIVLSTTPSIIVYTDVNRNAVFEPEVDKREVFLTGFQNKNHDHTVHAVVGAPSGQWHFSFGNCGADIRTKDGRHYLSGCYYGYPDAIGKPSSDGEVYVGGMTMRINPDGTGLRPTGENMRNPHDMFVTSQGDIFQSDNDDPAHCRSSWVMEYANMGYADLKDGSRSWEEVAKTWEEPAGWNKSRRFSRSHWRENYPGAFPPGSIYGTGSPTGNLFIEDGTLGLAGTYLVCCMVRKEIMSCRPELIDAQIEMGRHQPFVRLKADKKGQHFLPTDIALAPDGSLFFSDFFNDTSRRTNQVSGSIYRITRKDQTKLPKPRIDFNNIEGLVDALANPAVNVRSHAASQLVARGEKAFGKVNDFLEANEKEGHLRARAIWVLAQLGDKGRAKVAEYLTAEDDAEKPLVAYRALRHADPGGTFVRAKALAKSKFLSVRREVALSLRDVAYDQCKSVIGDLIDGYDGRNRYYLEALGVAFTNKEKEVYRELVAPRFPNPEKWSKTAKRLAWRLYTPESIRDLDTCIRSQVPPVDEFRFLAMAFASFRNDEERKERKERLLDLGKLTEFQPVHYQVSIREIVEKDLNNLEGELMTASYQVPENLGEPTSVSTPAKIAKLKGNPERGKAVAGKCYICHKIDGAGAPFGPELTHWGKQRTIEQIVHEIVSPDEKLAHGYEQPIRVRGRNNIAEGFMSNYSWHAGSLKIKVMGGETRKILFRRAGAKIDHLKESWMPSASELGLSDQDLCDVAHFLKQSGTKENSPQEGIEKESVPPKGHEPGWEILTGDDFVNVNCQPDTWAWKLDHAFCTGKPTGVIRYREPLKNFELLCEWMHKKKGGNSGVFVWATPQSIAQLASGKGRLPKGIEVQVLDLGYAEVYKARHKKPADWFTSHGDVFPVGPIKMRPFPPVAPNGRRSFPSKETTKGINQWNHYYVKAIDGEVRLWVNGEEVSGGDNISPSSGYLCLESEGAPIEFRNIRLRKLSSSLEEDAIPVFKPRPTIDLKGHPTLGKWYYGGHSREITEDGMVTLREGNNIQWKRRCISKTKDGFVLEGNLSHQLVGEVLNIENRYKAKRK